ncbi:MAG: HD domain-containing protein [Calditrichaeota bacterium]|nr:MAG: HD domain-containing protein [Calditrichota bacterium]MBL1206186.1 HD domain-containing protein [Calditrichota bacterium]
MSSGIIESTYALTQAQLQKILKLMQFVGGSTSTKSLIKKMVPALQEIVPCGKAIIWIYSAKKEKLWTLVGKSRFEVSQAKCIAGRTIKAGHHINLSNPEQDASYLEKTDSMPGAKTGHILCFPMKTKANKVVGVLQIMNTVVHPITPTVVNLISEWSRIAAGLFTSTLKNDEIKNAFDSFVDTISHALDTRDYILAGHSRRVTLYAMELAKQMGLTTAEKEILQYAGLLHDIGKIGIPELILLKDKRPTGDEFQLFKRHATLTRELLSKVQFPERLNGIVEIAATHHERVNGTGYPDGLSSEQIPRGGKILAVCDVFDALTSRRPYADRLPIKEVVEILDAETGETFEPFSVYHFKNITLDRVIQIIEYGHTEAIDKKDLKYLSGFALNDLVNLDKFKSDDQQRVETTFMRYYSRIYRG